VQNAWNFNSKVSSTKGTPTSFELSSKHNKMVVNRRKNQNFVMKKQGVLAKYQKSQQSARVWIKEQNARGVQRERSRGILHLFKTLNLS